MHCRTIIATTCLFLTLTAAAPESLADPRRSVGAEQWERSTSRLAGKTAPRATSTRQRTELTAARRPNDGEDAREERREERRDHRENRRDDRSDRHWRYRVGVRVATLPAWHRRVVLAGRTYFYADGVYLVAGSGGYVVVSAPIGARVTVLPFGFRTVHVGHRRYFVANHVYYVYVPATRDYVVVDKPGDYEPSVAQEPLIYPAAGQSEAQLERDRYECHRWAMDEADFDPLSPATGSGAEHDRYGRALDACLSGRGYTVA